MKCAQCHIVDEDMDHKQESGDMMRSLLLISLLIHSALGQKGGPEPPKTKWLTLNGDQPLVVARGGYSGLFPESTEYANTMAKDLSTNGAANLCSLQLTKDSTGLCLSNILLDNATSIAAIHPKRSSTYTINGKELSGWFALDFNAKELNKVQVMQSNPARPDQFDGLFPISTVEDVLNMEPEQFWLHVPIYLLDLHVFYTLVSAGWGFLLGASDRLGEIRSLEALHKLFEQFPGAFMDSLHIRLPNRAYHQSSSEVPADATSGHEARREFIGEGDAKATAHFDSTFDDVTGHHEALACFSTLLVWLGSIMWNNVYVG
ncbi:hypothetical protein ACLB2K_000161 [Fragaria x ananassa]